MPTNPLDPIMSTIIDEVYASAIAHSVSILDFLLERPDIDDMSTTTALILARDAISKMGQHAQERLADD